MPFLLDSDVTIEHLGYHVQATRMLDRLAGIAIYLGWVTLAELYEGHTRQPTRTARSSRFAMRSAHSMRCHRLTISLSDSERFAHFYGGVVR
jgi:hypothetical protein